MTVRKVNIAFGVVCAALYPVLTILIYRQTVKYEGALGLYHSDLDDYVLRAQTYDGPSRAIESIWAVLFKIDGSTIYIALFQALIVVLTIVAIYILVKYLLKLSGMKPTALSAAMSTVLIFGTSIAIPMVYWHFYLNGGAWGRYTWHSPTQEFMMLFALLSCGLFIKLFVERNNANIQQYKRAAIYISLSACILLSVWAKPSFAMCFIPAAALLLLRDAIISHEWKHSLITFATFLPAGIYMIVLYLFFFGSEASRGTQIAPGAVFMMYNITLGSGLLSLAFPITVLLNNLKELKASFAYGLSWLFLLAALGIGFMLAETGGSIADGNYLWSLWFGVLFVFVTSLVVYLSNFKSRNKAYLIVAGILFLLHTVSGLIYFWDMLHGASFFV